MRWCAPSRPLPATMSSACPKQRRIKRNSLRAITACLAICRNSAFSPRVADRCQSCRIDWFLVICASSAVNREQGVDHRGVSTSAKISADDQAIARRVMPSAKCSTPSACSRIHAR